MSTGHPADRGHPRRLLAGERHARVLLLRARATVAMRRRRDWRLLRERLRGVLVAGGPNAIDVRRRTDVLRVYVPRLSDSLFRFVRCPPRTFKARCRALCRRVTSTMP